MECRANVDDVIDPTPPPLRPCFVDCSVKLPKALKDVPVNLLGLPDRLSITASLFAEVVCELFPLEAKVVPMFLGLRCTLSPRCSASISEVTAEGRATLQMLITGILLVTAPVQDEPLTGDEMRMLPKHPISTTSCRKPLR